ncbi:tetratricopeptide repeat protein [Thioalkalivibrio sp. AKL12]|uniref:tetratricopeptide repeat protein n=1 Tax=Thioalkalivibrio sp. AKL12 TaxID=1158159 RepID=UPI0004754EB1|nr:tetratricopeptide repeat protein [Thioalkalivibrio sp. AKL12]
MKMLCTARSPFRVARPAGSAWRPAQWLGAVALAALLAACATPAPRDASAPVPDDGDITGEDAAPSVDRVEPREPERAPTPAAALNLAQQAESARQAGDTARAEQRLERALRIAPRDAGLWHQMATLRMEQGRYQQAERLAGRSLQMVGGGDRELALQNWRLILKAREKQGDAAGADEAREAIRRLEADIV